MSVATNSVQSITDHGAVSGGPDCAPAFAGAIAAAGPAGTVYIPPGRWVIRSTVTTGGVNLTGDGWQSCIVSQVGADNDAVVVNPAPQVLATSVNLVRWEGLSIMGAEMDGGPCCRRGLVIDTVLRSVFRNVHVLVAAAEYCVYVRTGWSNTFNFICSNDVGGIYSAGGVPIGSPQKGFIYGAPATEVGALNANVFDCLCEGLPAPLLYLDNQTVPQTSQGDNWITGTYEGTIGSDGKTPAAPAIYAEGGYGLVISNVYTEATTGIHLVNCRLPTLTNTLVETVVLDGTTDARVDQMDLGQITITATCDHTRLGTLLAQGSASGPATAAVIDLSPTTVSLGSIDGLQYAGKVRYTSNALTNGDNLVLNGDFSRWVQGAPEGWDSSPGTVTRTGAGQADTTRNQSPSAACFTTTEANAAFWYALPPLQAEQWFGASVYVYLPTGQALTQLELVLMVDGQAQPSGVFAQVPGGWSKLQASFNTGTGTGLGIGVQADAAGIFYVADAQAAYGVTAPSSTFVPAASSMPVLYLGGQSIRYGAAAPTSGSWLQGDVVYNTAPAPGGWVGWVCTATGTPGTWTQFGQIASSAQRFRLLRRVFPFLFR